MDGGLSGYGRTMDWPALLLDMRRHGWSVSKIAEAMNLPRKTVDSWLNEGVEPKWRNGATLLDLYAFVVLGERPRVRFAVHVDARRNIATDNALRRLITAECPTPTAATAPA